ncbi:hypothetical protein [Ferrimonas sp. SCSIO 43195]|uniref:hypothetical protein n=1 Tax=Ferrimonas sp. SCSIO 43195 TaxID=2822844 RepID=UPI002075A1EF|nr:hypothetical protein [Ferrimonas sp. SCSIO 43195]USD39585.1 hypothetical protein J8Z22_11110 [Ferrimonas sp. SCSIO 43195]
MSAQDKLAGYASGFGSLDPHVIADNVTAGYRLLDKNGAVVERNALPQYIAELRKHGDEMQISDVMVDGDKAWCKRQIGEVIGAGLIRFSNNGVSQEQLFYS